MKEERKGLPKRWLFFFSLSRKGKWREGEENLKVKEVKEMKHEIVFQKVVFV